MMAKKPNESQASADLRRQAEERLRTTHRDLAAMSLKDVQQLVQELQVHQIELKKQNDELRRVEVELETVRDRYAELYDFAPSGYLTLNTQGQIIEANLRACTMLGVNRKDVLHQSLARFILPEDAELFRRHWQNVLKSAAGEGCQVRLREQAGVVRWIYCESLTAQKESGRVIGWRMALLDISLQKQAEQELQVRQARLDGIIGSAMDAIITTDEGERIVLFNAAAESMFRCPAAEAIGRPLDRFIPTRFREAHHRHIQTFGRSLPTSRRMGEHRPVTALREDGVEFPVEASISHSTVEGKKLYSVILRDVTERQQAQEILAASESFARTILDSLPSHICVLNRKGVILRTNDAWRTFSRSQSVGGLAVGEVGQNYLEEYRRAITDGQPRAAAIINDIEAVLVGSRPRWGVEIACPSAHETRWFLMRAVSLKQGGGAVLSLVDISERVRLQQDLEQHAQLLHEHQEQLRLLSGKLLEAQDQERRRIARDLHDDFSQRLAALVLDVAVLERQPAASPGVISASLEVIRRQLEQLSDDIHSLAYTLHPSPLDHLGLDAAIQDHVTDFTKRTSLPVTFRAREVPRTLSPDVATCLFRVMQEALHNVAKHASATGAMVKLSGSTRGVGLSVTDNGKGFDVSDKIAHQKGLGLVSLQERLRLLNGFLRVHSRPAEGTKLCAWVPLKDET